MKMRPLFRKECVIVRVLFLCFFLVSLASCALFGGGSETLHRARGYEVTVPEGWKEQDTDRESDRAYKTPSGNVATVTSSCQRNANAPLEVLTRHLLLGARNTSFKKREKFFISGREGLYSSVKTTLEGSPFFLEIFVLPKNSCVFDFSLVSNKEIPEQEKTEFMAFFKSFVYGSN